MILKKIDHNIKVVFYKLLCESLWGYVRRKHFSVNHFNRRVIEDHNL